MHQEQLVFHSSFIIAALIVSVERHALVNLARPRINPAREVVEFRETLTGEERADLRAAYPVMTHKDDLAFGRESARPFLKATKRQQVRAFDAGEFVFDGFAHVYELKRRSVCFHSLR